MIDSQREAETYFLASDPGWQAAQLLPINQAAHQAGLTLTRIETNKEKVWGNATWTTAGKTYQRLLFFEGRGSRYQQIGTDPIMHQSHHKTNRRNGIGKQPFGSKNRFTMSIFYSCSRWECPRFLALTVLMVLRHYGWKMALLPSTAPIRWLKFLSYQPSRPSYRLIPARPSIAQETACWQILPHPRNEAMRSAFPFSQPVIIGDMVWFETEMITAVSPQQAAQSVSSINWFSPTYSLSK